LWVSTALLPQPCPESAKYFKVSPTQRGLAWKAVAQPHTPMALLAQVHKDWGCVLALPPQTSNIAPGSLPDV